MCQIYWYVTVSPRFTLICRISEFMLTFLTCEPVSHLHLHFHLMRDLMWLWLPLDQTSLSITITSSILLFELTCPLDSAHHLEQARYRKQNKVEYHQILSELDRLKLCYKLLWDPWDQRFRTLPSMFSDKYLQCTTFYWYGHQYHKVFSSENAGHCLQSLYSWVLEDLYGKGPQRVVVPNLVFM